VKQLKLLLQEKGVDYSDCVEKQDLVRRVKETEGMSKTTTSITWKNER